MNENELKEMTVEVDEVTETKKPGVWDKVKGGLKKAKDTVVDFVYDHDEEIACVGMGMCAGAFALAVGRTIGYIQGLQDGTTYGQKSNEAYFELGKMTGKSETLESIVSGDLEVNKF